MDLWDIISDFFAARDVNFYIAQAISIVNGAIGVITMQLKNMRLILAGQLTMNLCAALTFFFLDGFSGAGICFIAIAQTAIMFFLNIKQKKSPVALTALFILLYVGCSVIYYKSFIDVFSGIAAVCYAMSVVQQKPAVSRLWYVFNPICWIIYDIDTLALVNLVVHSAVFISTFIAMIKTDNVFKLKRFEKAETLK